MTVLSLLAMQAADAAPLATGSAPSIPWIRLILAFLFCIVIAVLAVAFIRKRNGLPLLPEHLQARLNQGATDQSSQQDRIQITQRLSVTPTSQLVVLRRGEQNYLLHLTNTGATEIDRFRDGEEADVAADGGNHAGSDK